MSGAEVVGLVLGAIPLLISAVEHYEDTIESVSRYRKFTSRVRDIHDTLILERTIFRAECVLLLATDISKSEAESMLKTSSHPLWRDETFHHRMSRCFGSLGDAMMQVTGSIVSALGRIALKITELGLSTGGTSTDMQQPNSRWRSSVKTKLKFALSSQASLSKDLELLTKLNERFAMLSSQIRQLENFYSTHKPATQSRMSPIENIPSFAQMRMASLDLYSAFLRACPANHKHFLRLGLNGISAQEDNLTIESKIRFDVRYCDHCKSNPQNGSGSINGVSDLRLIIDSSVVAGSTASQAPVEPSALPRSTKPTIALGERPAVPENKKAVLPVKNDDLCHQLSSITPKANLSVVISELLALQGKGSFKHTVVSCRSSVWTSRKTSLAKVLFQFKYQGLNFEIPQFQRLSIAEKLGTRVLQLYSTPWLAETLHSQELYFVGEEVDPSEVTRLGYTAFEPDAIYMDVELDAEPATSVVQMPTGSNVTVGVRQQSRFGLRSGPPNRWLYYLGILLIELAYHSPFTDLMTEMKNDYEALSIPLSSNSSIAEYQIACQLADNVSAALGASYAGIVRRCLRCDFDVPSSDLDDSRLQQSVYNDVVCKLRDLSGAFKALQVVSTA